MMYAIKRKDGGVTLLQVFNSEPAAEVKKWHPNTQAEHDLSSIAPVDSEKIPTDRTFRNAWIFDGQRVGCDMAMAAEIHRDYLRRLRAPLLAALDVEYQRADEVGNAEAKAEVVKQKQALRDCTADPGIDAAKSAEELKAVMPAALATIAKQ